MRILIWHVHGSWLNTFVRGRHDYVIPWLPDRSQDGLGRARTWDWPANVVEVAPDQIVAAKIDVVVLQRPHEADLLAQWSGLRAGVDLPAVYVEHNTPGGQVPFTRHPLADRGDIPVVHVTGFNHMMWDCGEAPTHVIEHAVIDHGSSYTGELERVGVVVNDPLRRGRAVGTDLLPQFAAHAPVDVFGMHTDQLLEPHSSITLSSTQATAFVDLPQHQLHHQLARRRVYLHLSRWTSLGLSLLEAMSLGMPVVALAATEVPRAVPPEAGVVATDPGWLVQAVHSYLRDHDAAVVAGQAARAHVLQRYALSRFQQEWDALLTAVT